MLSKDDLWDALSEYPDAKGILISRGRQILMKDNIFDEEIARKQDMEQEKIEQRVERVDTSLDNLHTRFARLLAEFNSTQLKLKQRVTRLESRLKQQKNYDAVSESFDSSDGADEEGQPRSGSSRAEHGHKLLKTDSGVSRKSNMQLLSPIKSMES